MNVYEVRSKEERLERGVFRFAAIISLSASEKSKDLAVRRTASYSAPRVHTSTCLCLLGPSLAGHHERKAWASRSSPEHILPASTQM